MTFRVRLFIAFAATAVVPLAILAAGVAHELDRRLTEADRRRAAALGAQTTQDVANAGSAVADRLAAVRDGLADDNRFREAVVQGALSERPYLLDYAARAMRLSGLAMLQIENDSGRILSSGHYRNEYDRNDPGLRAAVATAPGGAALMWARTPAGPMLVLARADSVRLGGRWIVVVGGVEASPNRLSHPLPESELSLSLTVAPPAGTTPIEMGDAAQKRGGVPVASFWVPAIATLADGRRVLSSGRFDVIQTASAIRTLRATILWWCVAVTAIAAVAALGTATWLAERISRPIRLLAAQSAQIDLASPTTSFSIDRADEIGALARVLGTMVRRLRAASTGLRDAERRAAVGDLARQVTHDVKNGLVPIRHVVRHLTEVQRTQPERLATVFAERRATLDASIGYLDELARNYARLSPGIDARPCDINAIVETVAAGFTTSAGQAAVALVLDPRIPAIHADALVMRRILENVVSNACDATGHSAGGVTIATRCTGAEAEITVADHGCGMSATEVRSAFSDFYTTKPHGTGLGLSIVRRLVRDVHGLLRVDSAPGRGTAITLTFPCHTIASAAPLETRAS
jgi:signal transduction histidine kinase